MILAAVYVAEMNRTYDVKLDETVPVRQLVQDLVGMISQKESFAVTRTPGTFLLCSREKLQIFDGNATLRSYGVTSGSDLLLV